MSPEQVSFVAQLLTLVGVVLSIVWASVQRSWTNQQRATDVTRLEEDHKLLQAMAEQRREQTAARLELQLEKRAADIRLALEATAGELSARQEALLTALKENTSLTQHGVTRADAAFHEANNINLKLAQAQTDAAQALQLAARLRDIAARDEG